MNENLRENFINKINSILQKHFHYVPLYKTLNIVEELEKEGLLIPPCKLGGIFYGINPHKRIVEPFPVYGYMWGQQRGEEDGETVLFVISYHNQEFLWGEEAFLTKEEALAKLNKGD